MPEVHNSSPQVVRSRTVQLTAADLLALSTTPFTLVPAPGPGMIIAVLDAALVYRFVTAKYEPASNVGFQFIYAGDSVALVNSNQFNNLIQSTQSGFALGGSSMDQFVNVLPGDDNKALQLIANELHGGPIVTATLGAGGAGYVVNDTGTVTTGNGDATYKVLTVNGGGAVLTFSITAPGTAYTVGNGQATAPGGAQPGVGAGFTVNITAVQNGDGTLKVTTYYALVPVP